MGKSYVDKAKKQIDKQLSKFESEYMTAKNDLVRVQAVNAMEELLDSEILIWAGMITDEALKNDPSPVETLAFVTVELKKLQDVHDLLDAERKGLLVSAKALYNAMKRSHVSVSETKHVSYEP